MWFDVAFEDFELGKVFGQDFCDDMADHAFLNFEVFGVFDESGFGVHHPKFGEVPSGFRFLRAKGRSKVKAASDRENGGF